MGQFHLDGREEVDHQCKSVLWEGGAFSDTQIRYTYLVRIRYIYILVLCAFLALDLDSLMEMFGGLNTIGDLQRYIME